MANDGKDINQRFFDSAAEIVGSGQKVPPLPDAAKAYIPTLYDFHNDLASVYNKYAELPKGDQRAIQEAARELQRIDSKYAQSRDKLAAEIQILALLAQHSRENMAVPAQPNMARRMPSTGSSLVDTLALGVLTGGSLFGLYGLYKYLRSKRRDEDEEDRPRKAVITREVGESEASEED